MEKQTLEEKTVESSLLAHSPIQEHHIDFLLEEEFACNQAFLSFFLGEARKNIIAPWNDSDHEARLRPRETWSCRAVRSATTSAGETDVLITYESAHTPGPRVAILIEDKIRAGFQDDQPERYRERGEEGQKKTKLWDSFFTCLVAPQKYSKGNAGFDTRVSLETILSFFSADDSRTKFKAQVFQHTLDHFAATGVQRIDLVMTAFRSHYAQEAEGFFEPKEVEWDEARDAWYDDSWFNFKLAQFPMGAKIVYKPKMGYVELSFANSSKERLAELLAKCSDKEGIAARQTGKSAAFYAAVEQLHDFSRPQDVRHIVQQSFTAVRKLLAFYTANKHLLATVVSSI